MNEQAQASNWHLDSKPLSPATKHTVFAWGLWDWGGAAFNAVVTTFVFAVYITSSAFGPEEKTSVWLGVAMFTAGLIIALLAPALGRVMDAGGTRKRWLGITTGIVAVCMALMVFVAPAPEFLLLGLTLLAVGNIAYEFAGVAYNAMITQISTPKNIGKVSGIGWGMGYLGGIVLLAIVLFGFIQPEVGLFGVSSEGAWDVRVAMLLCAVWSIVFAIPVFFAVPEAPHDPNEPNVSLWSSYGDLVRSIRDLWANSRSTLWFLISSAIFRDGLAGVFTFGAIVAALTFGFEQTEVILFAIVANLVAGVATILAGVLEDRVGAKNIMIGSLVLMVLCGLAIFFLHELGPTVFWIFGLLLCLSVGPVQSSSRTYLARLIPAGSEGQVFGLYATTGRAVSFLTPGAWTLAITLGGATVFGILGIALVLLAGLLMLVLAVKPERDRSPHAFG